MIIAGLALVVSLTMAPTFKKPQFTGRRVQAPGK